MELGIGISFLELYGLVAHRIEIWNSSSWQGGSAGVGFLFIALDLELICSFSGVLNRILYSACALVELFVFFTGL